NGKNSRKNGTVAAADNETSRIRTNGRTSARSHRQAPTARNTTGNTGTNSSDGQVKSKAGAA
ncbi:MAG: hypothetical protein ACOC0P_06980, partial [Planctomycetota bacterium]